MSEIKISDNLLDGYSNQYKESISDWRMIGAKYKAKRIFDISIKNNIKTDRVLEVGCGDGSILSVLSSLGYSENMYGLEISEKVVSLIRQLNIKGLKDVRVFDGMSMPYEDKFFDVSIISHVLEHVEFERILIRELSRVSNKIIIEVPIDFRPNADQKIEHFLSYGHINMYSPTTLRFLLKSEGHKIVDDIMGITEIEVSNYNYFYNQKNEPAEESNILKRVDEMQIVHNEFNSKDRASKEACADYYNVLVSPGDGGISIF